MPIEINVKRHKGRYVYNVTFEKKVVSIKELYEAVQDIPDLNIKDNEVLVGVSRTYTNHGTKKVLDVINKSNGSYNIKSIDTIVIMERFC